MSECELEIYVNGTSCGHFVFIPHPKPLCDQIRERRKELGLTQEIVARRARIGVRTLRRYERGERDNIGTFAVIAGALGCPLMMVLEARGEA